MKNDANIKEMMKYFLFIADKSIGVIRGKMDKEILTIDEVAEMFSVSKRTVYSLLSENKLPGVKIGGQWRFLKNDLMKIFSSDEHSKSEKNYDGQTKNENSCC